MYIAINLSLSLYVCVCVCVCVYIYNLSIYIYIDISVQFHSVIQSSSSLSCVSLWPHGLQYASLPCPSPTLGLCLNSCASSQWCHHAFCLRGAWTSIIHNKSFGTYENNWISLLYPTSMPTFWRNLWRRLTREERVCHVTQRPTLPSLWELAPNPLGKSVSWFIPDITGSPLFRSSSSLSVL